MSSHSYQFALEDEVNAVIQMLAFSLEIRKHLISKQRVIATIPKAIFDELPNHIFEELIYDNLLQVSAQLHLCLDIKVKAVDHFSLQTTPLGIAT
jgi:hypothetical protein